MRRDTKLAVLSAVSILCGLWSAFLYCDSPAHADVGFNSYNFVSKNGDSTVNGAITANNFSTTSTTSPQYQCTGAAACDVRSASGQNVTVDSLGGASTASLGATNATTTIIGRTSQTTTINGIATFASAMHAASSAYLGDGSTTYWLLQGANPGSPPTATSVGSANQGFLFVGNGTGNVQSTNGFDSQGTTSPQYQCSGAVACDYRSVSGQNITVDSLGGTSSALLGTVNATTTTIGRAGQTTNINGGTVNVNGSAILTSVDFVASAYDPFTAIGTLADFGSWGPTTNASTIRDIKYTVTSAGAGAGNQVTKVCDTAGCGSGVIYGTCTTACTGVAGTVTACTVNTSAIAASKTLHYATVSACGTTDMSGNFMVHATVP